jgi:cytoskeletal protein CcmA (bactofilin family)
MMKMEYSEIPETKIAGSGRITVPGYGMFKISGSGKISPQEISTSGSSRIPGGLKVGELRGSGSTQIEGSITAESVRFSGSARIEGSLSCGELNESGSILIAKDLNAKYARLSGSSKIKGAGDIEGELESSGSIMFGEDLVSEDKILFSGVMHVDGKVKAKSFEARLSHDESYIRDGIEADYVNIQQSHRDWGNKGLLRTRDIVGDDIILENVECDNIRGRKVTILGGCTIKGSVDYTETINVDPSSDLFKEPKKVE